MQKCCLSIACLCPMVGNNCNSRAKRQRLVFAKDVPRPQFEGEEWDWWVVRRDGPGVTKMELLPVNGLPDWQVPSTPNL